LKSEQILCGWLVAKLYVKVSEGKISEFMALVAKSPSKDSKHSAFTSSEQNVSDGLNQGIFVIFKNCRTPSVEEFADQDSNRYEIRNIDQQRIC